MREAEVVFSFSIFLQVAFGKANIETSSCVVVTLMFGPASFVVVFLVHLAIKTIFSLTFRHI